jgi:hypothetical protein
MSSRQKSPNNENEHLSLARKIEAEQQVVFPSLSASPPTSNASLLWSSNGRRCRDWRRRRKSGWRS